MVSHNPYLTTKYNAHINVEICATFVSVKYVYKYVYKGHDRAQVDVSKNDEIQKFINARYVSAAESCRILFSFPLHNEFPHHQSLSVYLPDQQPVYFDGEDQLDNIIDRNQECTTLTGWFEANREYDSARQILYIEFPEHFVWVKEREKNYWKIRERGQGGTIGRIYAISPKDSEKYCLRMLLYHLKGATSFDHIRTVNGISYSSFREAAYALNLLNDDSEWITCLEEASYYKNAASLRNLYAIILVFNNPSDPFQLWDKFSNDLSEDFLHKKRLLLPDLDVQMDQQIYDCALYDIDEQLQDYGFSLNNYSGFTLPSVDPRGT